MSVEAGFDLGDLQKLNDQLLKFASSEMPKETKKFVRREGERCATRLKNAYKTKVKKKTGNLIKGVGRGMPRLYNGSYQVRVYNNAPHAHLIEHGHVLYDFHGKPVLNEAGQERWVDGKYVAAQTVKEYKEIYAKDADEFVDELIKDGWK